MKLVIKRILSAIVFWAIVIGLVIGIGPFFRPSDITDHIWSYFYREDKDSVDALFIGSSAMYRYWIPPQAYEEQGFQSFLLAQAAQPIETVPYIMEEAVKTQSPKVIVVETRQFITERGVILGNKVDQAKNTYDLSRVVSGMRHSLLRVRMVNDLLVEDESNKKFEWNIPLLKYHDTIFKLSPSKLKERLLPGEQPLKGAIQTARIDPMTVPQGRDVNAYQLEDKDKEMIDLVVQKANELNVEVLFVATPYIPNKYLSALQYQMDLYMEEKGYAYLNLSQSYEELGINPETDFYNTRHTNVVGAKKVTSCIAAYLAQHYDMQGDMTDAQKKEWDKALLDWKEEEKVLMEKWEENCKELQEESK